MKINKLLIAGLSVVGLASCSDYLDVDAPSKNEMEYVYADKTEINRALNGAYASLLSDHTFGSRFVTNFCLNSDVDFYINNNEYSQSNQYRRFDCDADGGELALSWSTIYQGIERANILCDQIPQSPLWMTVNIDGEEEPDADMLQMLGEAKVIRAILYHELTWMFGDVPFSMDPSYKGEAIYPVVDRTEMLTQLIDDLKGAADGMKFAEDLPEGVERISKEACWAMIARLAMTAGGYSLRPDGDTYGKMSRPANYLDFYKTAMEYAGKVIESNTHSLTKDYYKVFVDECNNIVDNADDPIFEIPFAKESTGSFGYNQGPKMDSTSGETIHPYGAASSSARLNSLYRFSFDQQDMRRNFVNCLWGYSATNVATLHNDRTVYNGKWSKLWVNGGLGSQSESQGTGINFAYIRYADVLLTYAEAVCEIEDGLAGAHGAEAQAAVAQVRARAFKYAPEKVEPYVAANIDKESALKMILNERKWEFAGENMRWRDCVRNNIYNEVVYWTFMRYYGVAENAGQSSQVLEEVSRYDFDGDDTGYDKLPYAIYYKNDQVNDDLYDVDQFPNQSVKVVDIVNPYSSIPSNSSEIAGYSKADYFNWYDEGIGGPQTYFLYSLRGYIYADRNKAGDILVNNNGTYSRTNVSDQPRAKDLPVIRYILPYPRTAITHSNGKYVNKYGYR